MPAASHGLSRAISLPGSGIRLGLLGPSRSLKATAIVMTIGKLRLTFATIPLRMLSLALRPAVGLRCIRLRSIHFLVGRLLIACVLGLLVLRILLALCETLLMFLCSRLSKILALFFHVLSRLMHSLAIRLQLLLISSYSFFVSRATVFTQLPSIRLYGLMVLT